MLFNETSGIYYTLNESECSFFDVWGYEVLIGLTLTFGVSFFCFLEKIERLISDYQRMNSPTLSSEFLFTELQFVLSI